MGDVLTVDSLTVLVWIVTFSLASTALVYLAARRWGFLRQALAAVVVWWALAIAFHLWAGGLSGDEFAYHSDASAFAKLLSGEAGIELTQPESKRSIAYFLGFVYFLSAPNAAIGLSSLALFTGLLPIVIGNSSRVFGFIDTSQISAWLVVVAPPLVLWSPWLRREGLSFLLLALSMLGVALVLQGRKRIGLPLVLAVMAVLTITRPQLIVMPTTALLAAYGFRLWLARNHGLRALMSLSLEGLVAMTFACLMIATSSGVLKPVVDTEARALIVASNSAPSENLRVDHWVSNAPSNSQPQDGSLKGLSGKLSELGLSSLEFTVRLVDSSVGPMPWTWDSPAKTLVGLDGVFFAVVWLIVLVTLWVARGFRRPIVVILCGTIPLVIANSLLFANYGLAARIRAHELVLLVPVLGLGIGRGRLYCRSLFERQPS